MHKMATTLALLVSIISLIAPASAGFSKQPNSLVIRLIHSNLVRAHHETPKVHEESSGTIMSHLTPWYRIPAFFVNVSVGTPPLPQLLHVDTGSSFIWVQSKPCRECFKQALPIFDPFRSSTFRREPCKTPVTDSTPVLTPDHKSGLCFYSLDYLDKTGSKGILARDTITFKMDEAVLASIPDVVFGCGHENYGNSYRETGVLGLGMGNFSLVKRFGEKFSCCFGNLMNPNYPHNILILGEGARLEGDTTELEIVNGHYYVKLDSISIGGRVLPIEPSVFARSSSVDGGTIIDTGCSRISLVREAYEPLSLEIEKLMEGLVPRRMEEMHPMLCYNGSVGRELVGFPYLTFSFEGGAEISVDPPSFFHQYEPDVFCLMVDVTPGFHLNMIGVTAMQNYNIGFHLKGKKVHFESIDCEALELDS